MRDTIHEELKPISEFPANIASFLEMNQAQSKAWVYADQSKGAVVLNLHSYRSMKEELDLLRDIHQASQEIDAGKGVPHDQALKEVLSRLG